MHSELGIGKLGSQCGTAHIHHVTAVVVCSLVNLAILPPSSGNCTPGLLGGIPPPPLSVILVGLTPPTLRLWE